jgi:hypothetical protein
VLRLAFDDGTVREIEQAGRKRSLQAARADARTRTEDPFITSEVLYQLSYVGGARSV